MESMDEQGHVRAEQEVNRTRRKKKPAEGGTEAERMNKLVSRQINSRQIKTKKTHEG